MTNIIWSYEPGSITTASRQFLCVNSLYQGHACPMVYYAHPMQSGLCLYIGGRFYYLIYLTSGCWWTLNSSFLKASAFVVFQHDILLNSGSKRNYVMPQKRGWLKAVSCIKSEQRMHLNQQKCVTNEPKMSVSQDCSGIQEVCWCLLFYTIGLWPVTTVCLSVALPPHFL